MAHKRPEIIRQLSAGDHNAPAVDCYMCLEPVVRNDADSLRLGCNCITHYHCLIAYLQEKIGDRSAMKNDGICCP